MKWLIDLLRRRATYTGPNAGLLRQVRSKGWRKAYRSRGIWCHRVPKMTDLPGTKGSVAALPGDLHCMSEDLSVLWIGSSKHIRTCYQTTNARKRVQNRTYLWFEPKAVSRRLVVQPGVPFRVTDGKHIFSGGTTDWLLMDYADRRIAEPHLMIMSNEMLHATYTIK